MFDIDLNPDSSVTVSWTAQEIDDDEVGAEEKGGRTIAKDDELDWSNLKVEYDHLTGSEWSTISFTIKNDPDSA